METAYLGIGANIGSESEILQRFRDAVEMMGMLEMTRVTAVSSVYRTAAWGVTEQAPFLNAAIAVETQLAPQELLRAVKQIEADLGRVETYRWGPRMLDIDILLYGSVEMDTPELTIPHKHLLERAFALLPLLELAPDAKLPDNALVNDRMAVTGETGVERLRPL